jgi:hypothetical protein
VTAAAARDTRRCRPSRAPAWPSGAEVASSGSSSCPAAAALLAFLLVHDRGVSGHALLAGGGAVLVAVALTMEPYRSCSDPAPTLDAGEEWSCGGLRRELVLAAGALALGAAVAAVALERRRRDVR